jgi:hypothetical protein
MLCQASAFGESLSADPSLRASLDRAAAFERRGAIDSRRY